MVIIIIIIIIIINIIIIIMFNIISHRAEILASPVFTLRADINQIVLFLLFLLFLGMLISEHVQFWS